MNMKKISKLGVCLVGALAISGFAQDYSGQDLNMSFRDKRIDGFDFSPRPRRTSPTSSAVQAKSRTSRAHSSRKCPSVTR